jgi:RNA polymerase sigma factor (sigma-70 family)
MEIPSDWHSLLRGDKHAWDRFVREAAPLVRAVARKVLAPAGQEEALPDVMQEAFMSLCRDDFNLLRRFDPARASLGTYLGVIASRRAVDWLRRTAPPAACLDETPAELLAREPSEPDRPLNLPDDLLTPRQALILRLTYELDMEVEEVARQLGIAAQTVRSLRHKALERLRAALGRPSTARGDVRARPRE